MDITNVILVTMMYLITITTAITNHAPKVHETVDEPPPTEYVRTSRHLDGKLLTPKFNYPQIDRMKTKYFYQQQADLRNLKMIPKKSLANNDWTPFNPKFLNSIQLKSKPIKIEKDLIEASSDVQEKAIKSDRQDYVYVNSEDAQNVQIDHNGSPQQVVQSEDFQHLLAQNPALKTLFQTPPQLDQNGTPQIDALQQQLDAVNKAREQELLEAAQKQADAHIKAQHEAIALAQKKAQQEALDKIAAHNQGLATISPQNVVSEETVTETLQQQEDVELKSKANEEEEEEEQVSALQARPVEQTFVGGGYYASAADDLRNAKPIIAGYVPGKQLIQFVPEYAPSTEATIKIAQKPVEEVVHDHYQQLDHEPVKLYSEEIKDNVPQYAAKYAFGYRILDEKHGNDFGHEEEGNGQLTKGHYYAKLPDGRKQKVEYYADKNGYHAKVSYEHVGKHPYVVHPNPAQIHLQSVQE